MNEPDLSQELGFALGDVTQAWRQLLDRRLRPLGLSQATWRALFNLERMGETTSQRVLAERIGIEGPSLVRLLDSLERSGLVARGPCPGDRRAKSLQLTPRARALLTSLHRVAREVREELLADVPPDDIGQVISVLARITANAERQKSSQAEIA